MHSHKPAVLSEVFRFGLLRAAIAAHRIDEMGLTHQHNYLQCRSLLLPHILSGPVTSESRELSSLHFPGRSAMRVIHNRSPRFADARIQWETSTVQNRYLGRLSQSVGKLAKQSSTSVKT